MTTLTLDRFMQASPANVWRCLTEPDLLRQWFCPHPVTITDLTLEMWPGGTFHFVMEVPGHGTIDEGPGCILLIEPQKRLIWTSALRPGFHPRRFGTGPMEFPMTAEMTLTPENGGTRYIARAYHATEDDSAKHDAMGFHDGWGAAAAQLEALAKGL